MKNIVSMIILTVASLVCTHYAMETLANQPEVLTLIGRIALTVAFDYGMGLKEATLYVSYALAALVFCSFYGLNSVVNDVLNVIGSTLSGIWNLIFKKEEA